MHQRGGTQADVTEGSGGVWERLHYVAGGLFAYTVQLTNSGPDDAADVVFSDVPPAGVTFNSCNSTAGTCTVSGGGASLNLATLPDGETVTITIQAKKFPVLFPVIRESIAESGSLQTATTAISSWASLSLPHSLEIPRNSAQLGGF